MCRWMILNFATTCHYLPKNYVTFRFRTIGFSFKIKMGSFGTFTVSKAEDQQFRQAPKSDYNISEQYITKDLKLIH